MKKAASQKLDLPTANKSPHYLRLYPLNRKLYMRFPRHEVYEKVEQLYRDLDFYSFIALIFSSKWLVWCVCVFYYHAVALSSTLNSPFFFFSLFHFSIHAFIFSLDFAEPMFTVGMILSICRAQQNMVSSRKLLCSL